MTVFVNPRAAYLDKIVKCLALLASDKPGERLAAADACLRLLKQHGLTWQEIILAKSVTKPTSKLADTVESKLGTVLACPEPLTDLERGFVRSINGRRRLSVKQSEWLDRLYRKAVAYYEAKNRGRQ